MSTLKSSCGCEINVAQWTAKRKIGSVKKCPLHKNAPELLEAAKAFVAWADECWGSWAINEVTTPEAKRQYEAAKAAIAKAEGRP